MARAAKKEVAVSLETVLWNCRVALRGVGSTEKNRDAVIALVFLKFAGDKFEKRRAELIEQYGDIPAFLEKASFYNAVNVFYLKETARWSYIVKNASANDIAVIIDQAMADVEDSNPSLKGTQFKAGEPVCYVQAYYGMEEVKCPIDGKLVAVTAKQGDKVQKGEIIGFVE